MKSTLHSKNSSSDLNLKNSEARFISEIEKLKEEDENIIWAASPLRKFSVAIVSGNQSASFIAAAISVTALLLSFFAYINEQYWRLILIVIIATFLFSLLDLWKIWNRKHTHYALSEKRLYIQLWDRWKPRIYSIYLSQLKYFSVDMNNDDSGVIHLVCYQHPNIYTMDLKTTDLRIHPTLENISKPERLVELLTALKVRNAG